MGAAVSLVVSDSPADAHASATLAEKVLGAVRILSAFCSRDESKEEDAESDGLDRIHDVGEVRCLERT